MQPRKIKILIFLAVLFVSCGAAVEEEAVQEYKVAEDFIPIYEIVWCKANYEKLQSIQKAFEENGEDGLYKELDKLNDEQVEEIQNLIIYLEETVSYIASEYSELSLRILYVLDAYLLLNLEDNPDNFDALLTATSICTAWYNSAN